MGPRVRGAARGAMHVRRLWPGLGLGFGLGFGLGLGLGLRLGLRLGLGRRATVRVRAGMGWTRIAAACARRRHAAASLPHEARAA